MNTNMLLPDNIFRLKFDGPMTFDFRNELEATLIDAMRRHKSLAVDLSDVREIDLYGVHLLGLLQSVGAVVALSPVVQLAAQRLLTPQRTTALGRAAIRPAPTVSYGQGVEA